MYNEPAFTTTEIPFNSVPTDNVDSAAAYATIEPQAELPPEPCPEVYAYIKEITPGTYGPESEFVEFDVLIGASCNNKSTILIKKIKFCKHSLARDIEAAENTIATVVEQKSGTSSNAKRLRELCGIPNSKNWV